MREVQFSHIKKEKLSLYLSHSFSFEFMVGQRSNLEHPWSSHVSIRTSNFDPRSSILDIYANGLSQELVHWVRCTKGR
ncbi:hypothetical protein JCM17380_39080 [Desulfosporosinus burensis]